jgi:hypothetical protein
VRLLLDSHVLLWWLADDAKLSAAHRELIADGANNVFVSAITIAELGIKSSIGKLDIPDDLGDVVAGQCFDGIPSIACLSARRRPKVSSSSPRMPDAVNTTSSRDDRADVLPFALALRG